MISRSPEVAAEVVDRRDVRGSRRVKGIPLSSSVGSSVPSSSLAGLSCSSWAVPRHLPWRICSEWNSVDDRVESKPAACNAGSSSWHPCRPRESGVAIRSDCRWRKAVWRCSERTCQHRTQESQRRDWTGECRWRDETLAQLGHGSARCDD